MKVLKFGGSSVKTPERIKGIIDILKGYCTKGERFAVVFSAFCGATDTLIAMSGHAAAGDVQYPEWLSTFCERHFMAIDELLTGPIKVQAVAEDLRNFQALENLLHGVFLVREASPRTLDYVLSFSQRSSAAIIPHARRVLKTNDHFGSAWVNFDTTYPLVKEYFTKNPETQVVKGFIGSTRDGSTTTLGRGGSDYRRPFSLLGSMPPSLKYGQMWTVCSPPACER
ncbi:MAG: hypothetical protein EPO28_17885 [Saprospiraceae bacterium]|nr:MAG: hypothetical protein EPO28_17885 [Saprospiraceae bacterium]